MKNVAWRLEIISEEENINGEKAKIERNGGIESSAKAAWRNETVNNGAAWQ